VIHPAVIEAREWIGTPYVPQARVKGIGCDCVGLIVGVGEQTGLLAACALPPYREGDIALMDSMFPAHFERIESPEPGAVLQLDVPGNRRHLAICAGNSIIHVYGRKYGVTEHPLSARWLSRVVSCWRFGVISG